MAVPHTFVVRSRNQAGKTGARIDGLHRSFVTMRPAARQKLDDLAPQQKGENQPINERVLSESYLIGCDDS